MQTMMMNSSQEDNSSENAKNIKKIKRQGLRKTAGGKKGRCVGSDPYWPHQALEGRCTPRSGRRSRKVAGHRPRSVACRAFLQTASCLLDWERGRRRGRGEGEGRWMEDKRREERNARADGTILWRLLFLSVVCGVVAVAAVDATVVDLTVVSRFPPPHAHTHSTPPHLCMGEIYSCIYPSKYSLAMFDTDKVGSAAALSQK